MQPLYGVLRELVRHGILESYVGKRGTVILELPSDTPNPVESLLRVIRQERERLDEEIEILNQRKEQLDTILSEYE